MKQQRLVTFKRGGEEKHSGVLLEFIVIPYGGARASMASTMALIEGTEGQVFQVHLSDFRFQTKNEVLVAYATFLGAKEATKQSGAQ